MAAARTTCQKLAKVEGTRLTALCDADENVLNQGVAKLKEDGKEVEGFKDMRKLLESKNIDAVSIATPNHWHSLAAIWAIQRAKMFTSKSRFATTFWEGRQLVKFARAHKKNRADRDAEPLQFRNSGGGGLGQGGQPGQNSIGSCALL